MGENCPRGNCPGGIVIESSNTMFLSFMFFSWSSLVGSIPSVSSQNNSILVLKIFNCFCFEVKERSTNPLIRRSLRKKNYYCRVNLT